MSQISQRECKLRGIIRVQWKPDKCCTYWEHVCHFVKLVIIALRNFEENSKKSRSSIVSVSTISHTAKKYFAVVAEDNWLLKSHIPGNINRLTSQSLSMISTEDVVGTWNKGTQLVYVKIKTAAGHVGHVVSLKCKYALIPVD